MQPIATALPQQLREILLAGLRMIGKRAVDPDDEVVHLSPGQAHAMVKRGVPGNALVVLSEYLGLGRGATAGLLGMNRTTTARMLARDALLPAHAAESLLRLLELDSLAKRTFETVSEAADWMRKPHPMLGGEMPLECAKSSYGARRVKDILSANRYGGVL